VFIVELHEPDMPDFMQVGRGTYFHMPPRVINYIDGETIVVGKYCSIAQEVTICVGGGHRTDTASTYPHDHFLFGQPNPTRSYRTTRNTVIANDVWIGFQALISGGVTIGNGAVVGTRAVVFSDVPPYAVVMGNPATVVRYRFSQQTVLRLQRIAWWDWPEEEIRDNVDWFFKPIGEFVEHFDPRSEAIDSRTADQPDEAGPANQSATDG
jgi:acetyltransferase-like isoleucine patch superfamily enzyme